MSFGMRKSHLRGLTSLMLLCFTPAAVSAAEFVEFYKNGVAAAESQNWTLAAEMMRQAIAEQPQAKTRIKKALYFRRYIPHFYLGKALFETGDCAGALAAWRESESQGVVKRYPEFQEIQESRDACGQMVDLQAALSEALGAVEAAENSATQARRRLSGLPGDDPAVQELLSRQAAAEASLVRVRARLTSGDVALGEVEQAATVAESAAQEFGAIRDRAGVVGSDQSQARQETLTAEIESLMSRARRDLRASEYLQPYPAAIERRRKDLEQVLERGRAASSTTLSASELEALQAELIRVSGEFRRSVAPPPAELQEAAEAFLKGDYSAVLAILEESEFSSPRAASHSHLLQAAAYFALYHSTGARDQTLIELARGEVLECQEVDPDRSPPAAIFSPRFVAFFAEQIVNTAASVAAVNGEEGP